MKRNVGKALLATVLIFFFSLFIAIVFLMSLGYENTYYAVTDSLIISLIFIVIMSTMYIKDKLDELKEELSKKIYDR